MGEQTDTGGKERGGEGGRETETERQREAERDGGFFLAWGIWGDCSTIHSAFALFFKGENWLARSNSILKARTSPQWLSNLRRLWPNVP